MEWRAVREKGSLFLSAYLGRKSTAAEYLGVWVGGGSQRLCGLNIAFMGYIFLNLWKIAPIKGLGPEGAWVGKSSISMFRFLRFFSSKCFANYEFVDTLYADT